MVKFFFAKFGISAVTETSEVSVPDSSPSRMELTYAVCSPIESSWWQVSQLDGEADKDHGLAFETEYPSADGAEVQKGVYS